jgi:hypothetical protein
MAIAAGVIAWFGVAPVTKWEGLLRDAAERMRPLAEMNTRLIELSSGRTSGGKDSPARIGEDLAALTGSLPPTTPEEFRRCMAQLSVKCGRGASELLEAATVRMPRHFATTEALCRQLLQVAVEEASLGKGAAAEEDSLRAEELAGRFAATRPNSSALGLLGNVQSGRFEFAHNPKSLNDAIASWSRAAALDPYGTTFPLRMFRTLTAAGRMDEARIWAEKLLHLDLLQRLDPLKRLTPEEIAAVKSILDSK